jgi:hypothetical protein
VLSSVAEALTSTARKWAFGGCLAVRGGELEPAPRRRWSYSYFNFLTARINIPHPAAFVRREVWQEIGVFDETIQYAQDIDLFLRIGRKFDPAVLDEDLSAMRQHSGSRGFANMRKAQAEELRVRRKYALHHPLATALGLARLWVRQPRVRRMYGAP